jgi:hypothetical protein
VNYERAYHELTTCIGERREEWARLHWETAPPHALKPSEFCPFCEMLGLVPAASTTTKLVS